MNRKFSLGFLSFLVIVANAFFVNTAMAATLLIEDFTAAEGTAITTVGWTAHSAGGTNAIVTSTPGLTLAGYPSSGVGNAVALTTSGEDDNRPFAVQTSGSVYAAFMVNVSEASTDPAGGYFFHLGPDPVGTTFRGRVFIKKDGSNNIAFGISKAATAAVDIVYTPFTYSLNTTYLLVVKYTIVDGATNDTVSLIVSTTVPETEPAATVTASDVGASDVSPATVSLRQGAAATSPTVRVDGIRIGTDWASITQAVAPADAPVDLNGDGKTDFAVARSLAATPGAQMRIFYNINGSNDPTAALDWGLNTDIAAPGDYDGDGKDDVAVWRPGAATEATFYILQSATNTLRQEAFGQTNDNPTVVGDYDGDGKDDLAVYRPGATGQQSTWFYRTTPNGPVTYVPWGIGGDFVAPGDYDGDSKYDFVVARNDGGSARFWQRTATGAISTAVFGLFTDVGVPGDYDGDGKTDLAVLRNNGGTATWYLRPSGGGFDVQFDFGVATDIPVQGDYDGDGKIDAAIFRDGQFIWRSTASGAVGFFQLGAAGDFPPANYNTH